MGGADCNTSCLEDCECEVALYDFHQETCNKQRLPLMYLQRVPEQSVRAFFKVGVEAAYPNDSDSQVEVKVDSKKETIQLLSVTVGLTTCSCIALAVAGLFAFRLRVLEYKKIVENGNFGLTEDLALRPFSYKEQKRATNGFKEELGKGSFGAVYRGTLYRGKRVVAVKRLEKMLNEGEREFCAEMRVIGATNHRHLVRLLGFCAEASKRLLVYEFMSNGSLADLLFRSERRPDWNERMTIASEIARGILYLHEECETPIIHCDIKPQNILMDDFWTVKISDLEKLVKVSLWCIQDEPALRPSMKSVVMMLEGTTEISVPPCPTAATV
ncbi:Protein kinase domain-containing protein [Psidium guajava]|nr:Protein kinase domain-containing protein [Psidium guajava]